MGILRHDKFVCKLLVLILLLGFMVLLSTSALAGPEPRASGDTFNFVYDVGPGYAYAEPSDVPWESLQPGTLVRIHYREQPYANKWVLAVAGTQRRRDRGLAGVPHRAGCLLRARGGRGLPP